MPERPKIAIACMMQESNSFSQKRSVYNERGDAVCTQSSGTNTEVGGFLQGCARFRNIGRPIFPLDDFEWRPGT